MLIKFGLDIDLTISEVVQQDACLSGNCLQDALNAGAAYQKSFVKEGYDEIIIYYDDQGIL